MATVTTMKTAAETALEAAFASRRGALHGLAAQRDEAFSRYRERGLPHRRVEEWKYTDLRAALREAAPLAVRPDTVSLADVPDLSPLRIVIGDGHVLDWPETLPSGVTLVSLAQALEHGHPALADLGHPLAAGNAAVDLNTAFMTDGVIMQVAAGVRLDQPLHVALVYTPGSAFATAVRMLLVVGDGASAQLIETHHGVAGHGYQPNTVVEIRAGDEAQVEHVRLSRDGDDAVALSTVTAHIGREASLTTFNAAFGGRLSRHQVFATFAGESAKASINGVAMLKPGQHADATLVVDHAEPGGESRELFRTVVDDDATGVFQGKIIVRQKAQKTDGRMMSGALLLGDGATMNNKPELEIFADDVACAHGATCGALDEDLLFYLMARGLPKPEAEALLLQAFVGEAIETVSHDGVRDELIRHVEGWLRDRSAA